MMKTIEKQRFGGSLAILYRRQNAKCIVSGCNVYGITNLTRDHIIPQAIAKLYGWDRKMINDILNTQLMCPLHHWKKDRNVNQRIHNIRRRKEILDKIKEL